MAVTSNLPVTRQKFRVGIPSWMCKAVGCALRRTVCQVVYLSKPAEDLQESLRGRSPQKLRAPGKTSPLSLRRLLLHVLLPGEEEGDAPRGESWAYDRRCSRLTPEEVAAREAAKMPRAIRFKVPPGETTFRLILPLDKQGERS
jgi:hypothetical protein